MTDSNNARRVVQIEPPQNQVTFGAWKSVVEHNFPALVFPTEVALAITAQILIKDVVNPFALVLVDVPSSGKTITINFLSEARELSYATDKFTPAAFVSNAANVKREDLASIDLLPKLRYKTFLIRDLATLFSKRDDDLNELLGILTRVLDGEGLKTDTGTNGGRGYEGEFVFMMLAASTPIPYKVWKMMGSLGSRLFFLNMHSVEKTEEELTNQITKYSFKDKEWACKVATKDFLYSLWSQYPDGIDWNNDGDAKDIKLVISRCAKLLAKLRGIAKIWQDREGKEYQHEEPIIEHPDRINQLFYNLARGHALIQGRTQIDESDLKPLVELMLDSAPPKRARLIRLIFDSKGIINTDDVMKCLGVSRPTALAEMQILKLLGICESVDEGYLVNTQTITLQLVEEYAWFLTDQFKDLRERTHSQKELIK